MSARRPENDEPIEAKLADETPPRPAPAAPPPQPQAPSAPVEQGQSAETPGWLDGSYRPRQRKKSGSGLGVVVLLLVAFAALAIYFRKDIAAAYDRLTGHVEAQRPAVVSEAPQEAPAVAPAPAPAVQPENESLPPEKPPPRFEPRTEPKAPRPEVPEPPRPGPVRMKEYKPGLMYGVIDTQDLSQNGVSQFQMKVLVPSNYAKPDLMRMAEDVVESRRRAGACHAVRFLCYVDRMKTKEEDAFAEIVWAPDGNFAHASDALKTGGADNKYRAIFVKLLAP